MDKFLIRKRSAENSTNFTSEEMATRGEDNDLAEIQTQKKNIKVIILQKSKFVCIKRVIWTWDSHGVEMSFIKNPNPLFARKH